MNKDAINGALSIAENASNFEDLRHSIIIICNELLNNQTKNMDPSMNTYFCDDVDIKKIFYWATEYDDRFEAISALGEYSGSIRRLIR